MRRAAVAVMTAGVVLGVSAAASPGPAASARMVAGRAAPQGTKARAAAPLKTVEFAGYRFDVPASWPVYRLGSRPHQCVRYDKHAVYLGSPGPDQQCPAHLVGRTETIRISGGSGGSGGSRAARSELAGGAQGRAASMAVGGAQGRAGVRNVPGMLVRNAARREFGMTLHRPGLSIVATYGTRPGVVERIIASVRGAPAPAASSARLRLTGPAPARMPVPAPAGSAASTTPGAARSSGPAAPVGAPPAGTSASAGSLTPASAAGQTGSAYVAGAAVGAPAGSASIGGALPGFDTCTAPSLPAMQAWRSAYSVVGIYIGGLNRACDQSNLSVPWVRQVRAMGWLLIPTYVGLQPPRDPDAGTPCLPFSTPGPGSCTPATSYPGSTRALGRVSKTSATPVPLPVTRSPSRTRSGSRSGMATATCWGVLTCCPHGGRSTGGSSSSVAVAGRNMAGSGSTSIVTGYSAPCIEVVPPSPPRSSTVWPTSSHHRARTPKLGTCDSAAARSAAIRPQLTCS